MNTSLDQRTTYINSSRWSIPVYEAAASDPWYTVTDDNNTTYTFQIPDYAVPAAGTDLHMSVTQPDRQIDYEMWGAAKTNETWDARYLVRTDLLSTGMDKGARASGVSHLHGLIRVEEVGALRIPHSLALALDRSQLKSGPVWPANLQDRDGSTTYTGSVPMGTMFVLPQSVDIDSLGLTPEGRALAWTLQNYGAHVLIQSANVALYAEPDAEAQYPSRISAMRTAWTTLRPMLEVVTNNSETNVAGGGTRLQPPLPEVVAK